MWAQWGVSTPLLTAAEVSLYIVIRKLIFDSRFATTQDQPMRITSNLAIMSFIADALTALHSEKPMASVEDFQAVFLDSYSHPDGPLILEKIKIELSVIDSVENLHNIMDKARELLEVDANLSQNEVTGPSRICAESFLGIFIRGMIVKWELLDFEGSCEVFERMRHFMYSRDISDCRMRLTAQTFSYIISRTGAETKNGLDDYDGTLSRVRCGPRERQEKELSSILLQIQAAMHSGDIAQAEEYIHIFFDFNGSDPRDSSLLSVDTGAAAKQASGSGGAEAAPPIDSSVTIARAMSAMLALQAPYPRADIYVASSATIGNRTQLNPSHGKLVNNVYVYRHQHAMITIATMWTVCGNYSMALSAVEEAMNTAHQREDHHSVTKALLLMFHIFRGRHSDELLSVSSSEDILLRCLKRCAKFRMYSQISEIALLLAQCRSRGPMNPSYRRIKGLKSTKKSDRGLVMVWSTADIFNHISAALLGNSNIISQIVSSGVAMQDEENGVEPVQKAPTPATVLKNETAAPGGDPIMKVSPDLVSFSCKGTFLAVDVWTRLGMNQMGECFCRRYLRQFAACSASEDAVQIYCKMIFSKLATIHCIWRCYNVDGPGEDETMKKRVRQDVRFAVGDVKLLISKIKRAFPSRHFARNIGDNLAICRHYAMVLEAVADEDWQRSIRLASQLVQLTSRGAADESTLGPPLSEASGSGVSFTWDENLRMRILYADLLRRVDVDESLRILSSVEQLAATKGMLKIRLEAAAIRAMSQPGRDHCFTALKLLHETIQESRMSNVGYVEVRI